MNLVQTKQIEGLEGRLTTLETGTVKVGDLVGITGDIYQIASGNFSFSGNKIFNGNVTINSPQGLGIEGGGNLYVHGYGFIASGLNVGAPISDPRINTPLPDSMLHIEGGDVSIQHGNLYVTGSGYFEQDVYISGGTGDNKLYVGTGETSFCVNSDGSVGIGTGACDNPLGLFNVSGQAFLERAYVTGQDGTWMQLTGGGGGGGVSGITGAIPWAEVPTGGGAAGTSGSITYDASWFYVCVGTDTWKRTPLETF